MFLLRGKATNSADSHFAPAAPMTVSAPAHAAAPRTAVAHSPATATTSAKGTPESQLMQRLKKLSGPQGSATKASASPQTTSPTSVTATPRAFALLNLYPQSLLLQKSNHAQRYEATLELELCNREFSEVNIVASASFLKLGRSRVILSGGNREAVKVLLDERSPELLELCNAVLAVDAASCTTAVAGFLTVKTASEGEYTVDVSITRSACFLIRKQHQQATAEKVAAAARSAEKIRSASTPRSGVIPRPPLASSQRPPLSAASRTSTGAKRSPIAASPAASVSSVSSLESNDRYQHKTSTPKMSPAALLHAVSVEDSALAATAASLLALRHVTAAAENDNTRGTVVQTPVSRKSPPSNKRAQSTPRSSSSRRSPPIAAAVNAACDIRNFLRTAQDDASSTEATPVPRPAVSVVPTSAPVAPQHLVEPKSGVYFRKECTNFGPVAIGSLTRANIELCNATDSQVSLLCVVATELLNACTCHSRLAVAHCNSVLSTDVVSLAATGDSVPGRPLHALRAAAQRGDHSPTRLRACRGAIHPPGCRCLLERAARADGGRLVPHEDPAGRVGLRVSTESCSVAVCNNCVPLRGLLAMLVM
jgi:hypothetical protein